MEKTRRPKLLRGGKHLSTIHSQVSWHHSMPLLWLIKNFCISPARKGIFAPRRSRNGKWWAKARQRRRNLGNIEVTSMAQPIQSVIASGPDDSHATFKKSDESIQRGQDLTRPEEGYQKSRRERKSGESGQPGLRLMALSATYFLLISCDRVFGPPRVIVVAFTTNNDNRGEILHCSFGQSFGAQFGPCGTVYFWWFWQRAGSAHCGQCMERHIFHGIHNFFLR